jgi:hypothetical protein
MPSGDKHSPDAFLTLDFNTMIRLLTASLLIYLSLPLLWAQSSTRRLTIDSIDIGVGITAINYRVPNTAVSKDFRFPDLQFGDMRPMRTDLFALRLRSAVYSHSSIVSLAVELSISNEFADDILPRPITFVDLNYFYAIQPWKRWNKNLRLGPSVGIGTLFCNDVNTPFSSSVGMFLNYKYLNVHFAINTFKESGAAILEASTLDNPDVIPREFLIKLSMTCNLIAFKLND